MNKTFFERKYKCPICLSSFNSLTVRSSAVYVKKRESDFHNVYKGVSPLHYSIIVCPQCKYAASNTSFNKELNKELADQLAVALVKLNLKDSFDYSAERTLDVTLQAFKLAIITAQLKKAAPSELSGLLLAAAWIARESNNIKLEKTYLEEALKYYVEAFNTMSGNIGNLSDLQVTYLIGELYRRNGKYPEAIKWFNQVISHKNIKQNPNIEKLAREQWSLTREESKGMAFPESEPSEKNDTTATETESTPPEENNNKEARSKSIHRRSTMQFSANLYPDQIEWLRTISNQGYKNTNNLFPRETVLRSVIDFVMGELGENLPTQFTSETELIAELKKKIETRT